ncbi:GNAT family N-acetyltransferase [Paenibacillus brasilensis]|uniref:RimJ/RimL family protein N-acetyltransferase n=1 Tax=Paenibacillus brasilensis TaxID=128574 RepID=A0ABU0L5J5_9BACL|nr:GNAT family N-acetyltransferase [Paenibacillus brasilensis]MDQ0496557.1 RimJ/RimL family protein N-acetyltransferase [Paenibacillus brasilensis]
MPPLTDTLVQYQQREAAAGLIKRRLGRVNLSNVVCGAWESYTLGYFLDEQYNGQGFTTEAVRLALKFAFGPLEVYVGYKLGLCLETRALFEFWRK